MREIGITWLAVTAILTLITLGLFLGDTLSDVARGTLPAQLLFATFGLRSVESFTVLLPLSLFLSIMLALGRLYRDSEMAVLSACGVSRFNLYRPLFRLLVPLCIALLVMGLWVSPWALRTAKTMLRVATQSISVAGLQAGRFHEIAANDGVVYVETLSREGAFTNAFIHTERQGRKDVITAKRGYQYTDEQTGARYLALLDGFRSEGVPGQADYRWMHFARNDVRLPDREDNGVVLKHGARTLAQLTDDPQPPDYAELHWRLAPAMAALVLAVLAVPLSRTTPRQGYYGNLVMAILIYVIYANVLAVGRSWLERGELNPWFGLWWVHGLVLITALVLLRNRVQRRRSPAPTASESPT
jgi:lipopolysaccharide export system permease protein